jgi:hypothetical protein
MYYIDMNWDWDRVCALCMLIETKIDFVESFSSSVSLSIQCCLLLGVCNHRNWQILQLYLDPWCWLITVWWKTSSHVRNSNNSVWNAGSNMDGSEMAQSVRLVQRLGCFHGPLITFGQDVLCDGLLPGSQRNMACASVVVQWDRTVGSKILLFKWLCN